jgi:hypothetical protein
MRLVRLLSVFCLMCFSSFFFLPRVLLSLAIYAVLAVVALFVFGLVFRLIPPVILGKVFITGCFFLLGVVVFCANPYGYETIPLLLLVFVLGRACFLSRLRHQAAAHIAPGISVTSFASAVSPPGCISRAIASSSVETLPVKALCKWTSQAESFLVLRGCSVEQIHSQVRALEASRQCAKPNARFALDGSLQTQTSSITIVEILLPGAPSRPGKTEDTTDAYPR